MRKLAVIIGNPDRIEMSEGWVSSKDVATSVLVKKSTGNTHRKIEILTTIKSESEVDSS
jgi:hypothetical protein